MGARTPAEKIWDLDCFMIQLDDIAHKNEKAESLLNKSIIELEGDDEFYDEVTPARVNVSKMRLVNFTVKVCCCVELFRVFAAHR